MALTKESSALLALAALAGCAPPRAPAYVGRVAMEELGLAFVGQAPAQQPWIDVRLMALRVEDDDGRRAARVGPEHIAAWVAFANQVFRPAGVRIHFAPGDLRSLRSRRVNDLAGTGRDDWREAKRVADQVAARYPDRLVVFFRHGPGDAPTGQGFSWTDYNFVVLGGWHDDKHCGHEHLSALAHELGHYLGLAHTFASVFPDASQAAAYLGEHQSEVRAFDGDGLTDTAPDPGIRTTECSDEEALTLRGVRVPLPRRNIMSYYEERDSLSAQQIQRLRWFLQERRAHRMNLPKNGAAAALEAEQLEVSVRAGGPCSTQQMQGFGAGNWSDERQLFCYARGGQLSVSVKLPVASSGLQRVDLYATRAPDFGVLEVFLDGEPLGAPYDAWAPSVLASGVLPLASRRLQAGTHELSFVVRRKNPASSDFHLGVDAIALVALEAAGGDSAVGAGEVSSRAPAVVASVRGE